MARLLLLAAVVLGVLLLLRWFTRTPAPRVARTIRKTLLWGVIGLLVLAAATGRLNPIFAALAALIPVAMRLFHLAQMLPMLQRVLRSLGVGGPGVLGGGAAGAGTSGPGPRGASHSEIRTRFLAMGLDHASGAMNGEVLEGPFTGRRLSDLGLDQLMRMLELYREADPQSAAVLEAYLDRERDPDWREHEPAGAEGSERGGRPHPGGGKMTESEARDILGLQSGADPEAIRAAHRRLMQKLHPDRGGSDYLAAKINEAKRVLLGERA